MRHPQGEESRFRYRPLDQNAREIRLFRLGQIEDPSAPIQLTIKHVDLDEQPDFEALSYTWGDERPTYEILIREVEDVVHGCFTVRQNLHDFLLMQMEKKGWDRSTWFWVDQICINQTDLGERNHQVGQMAELYSSARRVIVWLGPCGDGSDDLLDVLGEDAEFECSSETLRLLAERRFDSKDYDSDHLNQHLFTHIKALRSLLTRPYWFRVWIIQEVCLAKEVLVCVGSKSIACNWLVHNAQDLFSLPRRSKEFQGYFTDHRIEALRQSRKAYLRSGSARLDWWSALNYVDRCECSDPRDRFYGMMALVRKSLRVEVRYDEDYSLQDIVHEIYRMIIVTGEVWIPGISKYILVHTDRMMYMIEQSEISGSTNFSATRKFLRRELCRSYVHKTAGVLANWPTAAYMYLHVRRQDGLSGKVSRFTRRRLEKYVPSIL